MSAIEIIEQIKALPAEERAQVIDLVLKMREPSNQSPEFRPVNPTIVEATAEKIFDRYDDLFRKLAK